MDITFFFFLFFLFLGFPLESIVNVTEPEIHSSSSLQAKLLFIDFLFESINKWIDNCTTNY